MNNKHRVWDKLTQFEEMYPTESSNSEFRCDSGFGYGKLDCYSISCSKGGQPLDCQTKKSARMQISGVARATLDAGYTMTGGGLINHYRKMDKKAMFEGSRPDGNNKWLGDMGAGAGDFTTYVRGCKGVTCQTISSATGNHKVVTCPAGYLVTGCGYKNEPGALQFNALNAFEESFPNSKTSCRCDGGIGTGFMKCYARCCK